MRKERANVQTLDAPSRRPHGRGPLIVRRTRSGGGGCPSGQRRGERQPGWVQLPRLLSRRARRQPDQDRLPLRRDRQPVDAVEQYLEPGSDLHRPGAGDQSVGMQHPAPKPPKPPAPPPLPGPCVQPWRLPSASASADNGMDTRSYYNTTDLSGPVVFQRVERKPCWNCGFDSPAPGVNADYFSIRWTNTSNAVGRQLPRLDQDGRRGEGLRGRRADPERRGRSRRLPASSSTSI